MDIEQVKVGMLVSVNACEDGQVYVVEEINGFRIKLKYANRQGGFVGGGFTDVCTLRKPTNKQLRHYYDQIGVPAK